MSDHSDEKNATAACFSIIRQQSCAEGVFESKSDMETCNSALFGADEEFDVTGNHGGIKGS